MQTQRLSTCLIVRDLAASVSFYREHLGFVVAYQLPWFATLLRPVQSEPVWDLSLLQVGHELIPERLRHTPTQGLILGVHAPSSSACAPQGCPSWWRWWTSPTASGTSSVQTLVGCSST
jgi:catechol 2,3-dioxygenase-like lactoylglutathione lyase family enzyme